MAERRSAHSLAGGHDGTDVTAGDRRLSVPGRFEPAISSVRLPAAEGFVPIPK
jgi:hypothetical protein